jgi:hypothetical protein
MTVLPQSFFASAPSRPTLIGLAALTRKAMRGDDMGQVARSLMARLAADPRDAEALLDLSTVEQLLGAGANRVALQDMALRQQRLYAKPAPRPGAPVLLVLLAPGDFMANTPVEFLLEGAELNVEFLYVDPDMDILAAAPPHDAAFVAVAESAANQALLAAIGRIAGHWPRPLLNAPGAIARLTRDGAWRLLKDVQGVIHPRNERLTRAEMAKGHPFPFIVRPVDSHAGAGLERIEDHAALAAYLDAHDAPEFYTAAFVDYRGRDGLYRKIRLAFVDGEPFPVHLAISGRWMIHYLNADMAESAEHRAEEERFMQNFNAFARRHKLAFSRMAEKLQLDYFQLDCAESADGRLLIFEVGNAMIVHDLDCQFTFPYKSAPMRRLFEAFQRMAAARGAVGPGRAPA